MFPVEIDGLILKAGAVFPGPNLISNFLLPFREASVDEN